MPGGGLFTIIIIIVVVWQIIGGIIAHTQQQKQKQAEAEARRQRPGASRAQGERPSSPAALAGGDRGQSSPKMSKLDELAARRQQQLDELRKRRESGSQGATARTPAKSASSSQWESSAQLRTGQTSAGAGLPTNIEPRGTSATRSPKRMSPGQKQQQVQQQQRLARQQQIELQQQQRATLQRERQLSQRRDAAELDRATGPYSAGEIGVVAVRKSERDAYGLAAPTAPDEPIRIDRVSQLLYDRATLRELIVMKEVLDTPVSLREPRFV